MPIDFLTDTQQKGYGHYGSDPSLAQLARYFHFDDLDQEIIAKHRGSHNRLGFAIQLSTVRFLGTFLANPLDVPNCVIKTVALQLNIADLQGLERYQYGETRWDHAQEIRQLYGYKDFGTSLESFRLVRWLYTRAWLTAERPSILFDLATVYLVENKILLPGVTTLARLVATVRDRVAARLWRRLVLLPSKHQQAQLEQLLTVPKASRQTLFDQLRRAPTHLSAPALVQALVRLNQIRALGVGQLNLANIPPSRIKVLARYALVARAQALARMPEPRRVATLLALAIVLETTAQDDVLDLLDQMISKVLSKAQRVGQQERLRTLKDLDCAALTLRKACQILLNPECEDLTLRTYIFAHISPESLSEAVNTIGELARLADDNHYEELLNRYSLVRQFLPKLLQTISFDGTEVGQPILAAWECLRSIEGRKKPMMNQAPLSVVNKAWQRFVFDADKEVDRRYYTFCTLARLQDCLHKRDIFVSKSERWGDPRTKLLKSTEWQNRTHSSLPDIRALRKGRG